MSTSSSRNVPVMMEETLKTLTVRRILGTSTGRGPIGIPLFYGRRFFLPRVLHEPPPEEDGEPGEDHPFERIEDIEQVETDFRRRRRRVDEVEARHLGPRDRVAAV